MKKSRLDVLVLERQLLPTRQAAQTAIMDGAVLVNGEKVTKPGMCFPESAKVELVPGFSQPKFVSRGGLKLEKALDEFQIDPHERICVDVGASTGGFTDCLLQRGAAKVFAVDVGYGQLDWKIRTNERVVVRERINARFLSADDLYKEHFLRANLLVADVSFISLDKILPTLITWLQPDTSELVLLVKPQFEVGRERVAKGGVVKSASAQVRALDGVTAAASKLHLRARAVTFSPVRGPAGNIEYLLHLANFGDGVQINAKAIVQKAQDSFGVQLEV